MTIRRKRTSVGVAVLVAAVAVGAFLAAGASARQSALPRSQTLYTSGTAWGPFTQFNPLRSSGNATGTIGLLYETLFRYDPLEGQVHPVARHERQVGRHHVRRHAAQGRDVERRQAVHGCGREVHVRDRQARGLRALDDVEDRPPEHRREGECRQLPLQGPAELPRLGDEHLHVRHRPGARLEELQTARRSRPATPTSTSSAPGRSATAPARGRPGTLQWNRRDNWWATKAARHQDADAVHRRHPQHAEHRVAAELPAEQHRPLEQLLPRGSTSRSAGRCRRTTQSRRTCCRRTPRG